MNPLSFTGGISVKVYRFYQERRGKDDRRIIYLEKKDIQILLSETKSGEKI